MLDDPLRIAAHNKELLLLTYLGLARGPQLRGTGSAYPPIRSYNSPHGLTLGTAFLIGKLPQDSNLLAAMRRIVGMTIGRAVIGIGKAVRATDGLGSHTLWVRKMMNPG